MLTANKSGRVVFLTVLSYADHLPKVSILSWSVGHLDGSSAGGIICNKTKYTFTTRFRILFLGRVHTTAQYERPSASLRAQNRHLVEREREGKNVWWGEGVVAGHGWLEKMEGRGIQRNGRFVWKEERIDGSSIILPCLLYTCQCVSHVLTKIYINIVWL